MNRCVLVLGARNDSEGRLNAFGIERCRLALERYHLGDRKIITTGGFGEHFNTTEIPHAMYMEGYLLQHGVDKNDLLAPVMSKNTLDDAALSRPIVLSSGLSALEVVTSDFHLPRVKVIFSKAYPDLEVQYFGSETQLPESELTQLRNHEGQALERLASDKTWESRFNTV